MGSDFANVYDDARRADAYARLEFPGTYHLAFRDLPALFAAHVQGRDALDFGCGAGRSTRFLRANGYSVCGVDIAAPMLERARALDPEGDYRLLDARGLAALPAASVDLVLSMFTFDNIPTRAAKVELFGGLARLLRPAGRLVSVVSSPEIYVNEWASFSTKDYPENARAASGDVVRIVMLDVDDHRPVEDVLWHDAAYADVYAAAGLAVREQRRPLAHGDEPWTWVSETRVAPWVVYVLERVDARGG